MKNVFVAIIVIAKIKIKKYIFESDISVGKIVNTERKWSHHSYNIYVWQYLYQHAQLISVLFSPTDYNYVFTNIFCKGRMWHEVNF